MSIFTRVFMDLSFYKAVQDIMEEILMIFFYSRNIFTQKQNDACFIPVYEQLLLGNS